MDELDFGKFRGHKLKEVPISYVVFLSGHVIRGTAIEENTHSSFDYILSKKAKTILQARAFLADKCWICGAECTERICKPCTSKKSELLTIDSTIDFGKHQGKLLRDIPLKYMIFLAGYRIDNKQRDALPRHEHSFIAEVKPHYMKYALAYLADKCWLCGGPLADRPVINECCHKECADFT